MLKVLIVEDDAMLNDLMKTALEKSGFCVEYAYNALDGIKILESKTLDLIVSDIMLPGMDGFAFAETVRKTSKSIPILFVTAKDSFEDKQKGFNLGIDDYMVKPIDLGELVLRVHALLRRSKIASENKLTVGGTVLDYHTFTVTCDGKTTVLPNKEFCLLFKLLSYPNRIFTRSQLMDEFWGYNSESFERTVDVHITRIREKFKDNGDFEIVTVRGLGYKAVKHE
ncbi:MAG: response regulator transcription factor [Clostridia bacterium]|nr:response regulator transcription factor [Clostridia bacterium]